MSSRPSVLLYAGDLDPSGEDIDRDFVERVGAFDKIERVAVTVEQIEHFDLPPQLGQTDDPRADGFIARHGRLVQVELEALDPDDLRGLYDDALARYWDPDAFEAVVEVEAAERDEL